MVRLHLPTLTAGAVVLALLAPVASAAPVPADTAPAAAAPSPAAAPAVAAPKSVEALVRERVKARVGGEVGAVRHMPFGLYEVAVDSEILYVDEKVNYLVAGRAFDLRTKEDLTTARKEEINRVDFSTLPLPLAVKTVRGSGARQLVVFEDPNCPYCKRFEHDIATLADVTIYTFLYPILSDDSFAKSKSVWCAPDRAAAWARLMLEAKTLDAAPEACQNPLEDILALGQKLHVTGTPTLIFIDGRRAPGAIPMDRVQKMLADAVLPAPAQGVAH
jgi:thiol:disulfide interchange protein DsbC